MTRWVGIVCLAWACGERPVERAPPSTDPAPARTCSGRAVPDEGPFGGRAALTFDDGPDVETTPRLAQTLRRLRVPAAFFVTGARVDDATRPIVRDLAADERFVLGDHGFVHEDRTTLDPARLEERERTEAELFAALGVQARWFRFPFGRADCALVERVQRSGVRVVGWHVDSADWCMARGEGRCRPADLPNMPDELRGDLPRHVVRQLRRRGGGIVLLHDGLPFTVEALPSLVHAIRRAGMELVGIDDERAFPRLAARP